MTHEQFMRIGGEEWAARTNPDTLRQGGSLPQRDTLIKSPGNRSANFPGLAIHWTQTMVEEVLAAVPKRFVKQPLYDNAGGLLRMLAYSVAAADKVPALAAMEIKATIFARLACLYNYYQCAQPAYFIDRRFMDDIVNMPTAECTFADIPFPAPGALFMLPKGASYFSSILIAHGAHVDGRRYATFYGCPSMEDAIADVKQSGGITEAAKAKYPTYSSVCPIEDTVDHLNTFESGLAVTYDPEVDGGRLAELQGIACKLMIAMSLRPDDVEGDEKVRKEKRAKSGKIIKSELWSPNFVGRLYAKRRKEAASRMTGRGVRLHWRRGHMRKQPYGPKTGSQWRWKMIDGQFIGGGE